MCVYLHLKIIVKIIRKDKYTSTNNEKQNSHSYKYKIGDISIYEAGTHTNIFFIAHKNIHGLEI